MRNQDAFTFLRRTLLADAAISGATGVLMAGAAEPLHGLLNLPVPLLREAGLALLPFAAVLVFLARRDNLSIGSARVVVAINILWVVASVALLIAGWVVPNALGHGFVLFQAVAVAAFAAAQLAGVRKLTAVA